MLCYTLGSGPPDFYPFWRRQGVRHVFGHHVHLKRDTAFIFLALCEKLRGIARVLGGRLASTMARAMAQNLCILPQIFYTLQFYCFSKTQHDTLTAFLFKPLWVAKGFGTKLHSVVLTNPVLGGYMNDVHSKIQEAKLRLFDRCIAEGGATCWAMGCLCLRLFRRQDKDSSLMSSQSLIPVPQPGDTEWWASLMVRRAASNFTLLAAFGPCYINAEETRHIYDWLPSLSPEATRFPHSYDLGCVKELVVWPPPFFRVAGLLPGGRVSGSYYSPVPKRRKHLVQICPSRLRPEGVASQLPPPPPG
jgi:hypothetical protein